MANFGTVGIIAEAKNFAGTIAAMSQFRRQVGVLAAAQTNLNRSNTASRASARGFIGAIGSGVGSLASFGQSIRNFGAALKGLGNEIAAVGFRLGFLVGLPLVSFFSATIKEAANFETQMVRILNLTDASAASVQQWSGQMNDLAVQLGKTPTELAEGLFAVTSAGITDTSKAMDVLTASAKASAIGLGETGVIAREVGGILGAYGAENITAAQAVDTLVAVVDQGNLEVDQLAGQLGRVTGLAATMGISISEVGAFIATFSRSGVGASVAISSLRAAMSAILNPTKEAEDTLAAAGTSVAEVQAAIADPSIGLSKTLIALAGLLGQTDQNMGNVIGSARGLAGALFNTGPIAGTYLQILDNIQESAGLTEEGFARLGSTTAFQANQARAALGVLGNTIGQILLPPLNSLLQALLPIIQGFAAWAATNPAMVKTITLIALLVAGLAPLLVIAGLLVSSIGSLIAVIGGLIVITSKAALPVALLGLAFMRLSGNVVNSAKDVQAKGSKHFAGVANSARGWGHNIVVNLARGIAEATIVVVRALIRIGNIITDWLSPGSPPKLLPELTNWGAAWMTELLHGFTLADFSVFNDLASLVESFLRSLGTDAIAEEGLVPAILGSRSAIAEAVEQMRTLGFVTEDVLNRISGGFGIVSDDIEAYVLAMLRLQEANEAVAEAQENLNNIEQEFDDIISPLQDELDAIGQQQQEWAEDQRIAELQAILAEHGDDPVVRERVLAELRAIELQRQIRAQEELRDAAVETATEELEAAQTAQELAQEQVETQQALIQAQIDNNNLIQEQIALLERLADSLEDVGGAGGDGGVSGLGGGLAEALDDLDSLLSGIEEFAAGRGLDLDAFLRHNVDEPLDEAVTAIDGFADSLQQLIDDIQAEFDPLVGEAGLFAQLKESWVTAFDRTAEATANLGTTIDTHQHTIHGFLTGLGVLALFAGGPAAVGGLATLLTKLGVAVATVGGVIFSFWGAFVLLLVAAPTLMGAAIDKYGSFENVLVAFRDAIVGPAGLGAIIGLFVTEAINNFLELSKQVNDILLTLEGRARGLVDQIIDIIITFAARFATEVETFAANIVGKIEQFVKDVYGWFVDLYDRLVGSSIVPDLILAIALWFGPELIGRVGKELQAFVTDIGQDFLDAGTAFIEKLIEGIGSMLQALTDALFGLISSAWTAAVGSFDFPLPDVGGGMGSSGGSTGGTGTGTASGGSSGQPPKSPPAGPPQFAGPQIAAPAAAGLGVTNIFNNNIASSMDAAAFTAGVRRVLRQELGTA